MKVTIAVLVLMLGFVFFCEPTRGQIKTFEITFCQFDVAENIRHGNASYSIRYSFVPDSKGRPTKLTDLSKLSDAFASNADVESCISSWRLPSPLEGSPSTAFFRWEHAKGWTELIIRSGEFRHFIRLSGSGSPYRIKP